MASEVSHTLTNNVTSLAVSPTVCVLPRAAVSSPRDAPSTWSLRPLQPPFSPRPTGGSKRQKPSQQQRRLGNNTLSVLSYNYQNSSEIAGNLFRSYRQFKNIYIYISVNTQKADQTPTQSRVLMYVSTCPANKKSNKTRKGQTTANQHCTTCDTTRKRQYGPCTYSGSEVTA